MRASPRRLARRRVTRADGFSGPASPPTPDPTPNRSLLSYPFFFLLLPRPDGTDRARRLRALLVEEGALRAGGVGERGAGRGGMAGGGWRGLALLAPCAVTAGLGAWQLRRKGAKEALLEGRAGELARAPRPLREATAEAGAAGAEFTPVVCRGVLEGGSSLRVGPRARSEMGITKSGGLVVSPLRLEGGGAALLLRGWAPDSWREATAAAPRNAGDGGGGGGRGRGRWFRERVAPAEATGPAREVWGVLRRGERPGPYTPENDPVRGQWFFVDPPAMSRALGLPEDTPLVEIVREPSKEGGTGAGPRRPPTPMEILALRTGTAPAETREYPTPRGMEDLLEFPVMPRDHLNYAATWLTLSAAVGAMAFRFLSTSRAPGAAARGGGGGLFPVNPCAPARRRPST